MKEKNGDDIPLVDEVEQFVKVNVELYTLRATGVVARVVSSILSNLVIGALVFIVLFMLAMGLALWIGDMLGNMYSGFLIIGGVFAIITIVIYFLRFRLIRKPVMNGMITQILKDKHHA